MSGNYLLDTNTAIEVLNQKIDLGPHRDEGDEFFLCLTVLGELFYGAEKSQRVEANRERIRSLAKACPILETNLETTQVYGALKFRLRDKGRPIPENDAWIAATALQYGLLLASRDGHFKEVEGLMIRPI